MFVFCWVYSYKGDTVAARTQITSIGPNKTVMTKDTGDGEMYILFSYATPVAAMVLGTVYVTTTKYSATTSKHIKQWAGLRPTPVDQSFIDNLVNL